MNRITASQYSLARLLFGISILCFLFASMRGCFDHVTPYQTDQIQIGMSAAEVLQILGEPHERYQHPDGSESWIYNCSWLGFDFFGISFEVDSNGHPKVYDTWI
jgi:hypothetical protein